MEYKRYKEDKSVFKDVEPLYISAFPEDERPPVFWLLKCLDADEDNDIIVYYESNIA